MIIYANSHTAVLASLLTLLEVDVAYGSFETYRAALMDANVSKEKAIYETGILLLYHICFEKPGIPLCYSTTDIMKNLVSEAKGFS